MSARPGTWVQLSGSVVDAEAWAGEAGAGRALRQLVARGHEARLPAGDGGTCKKAQLELLSCWQYIHEVACKGILRVHRAGVPARARQLSKYRVPFHMAA